MGSPLPNCHSGTRPHAGFPGQPYWVYWYHISTQRRVSINRSMGREESAYGQPSALGASAGRGPGSRAPSRKASRPSGFDPSCDHESLAGDTRLRVPPSFHSGVAITVPSAGAFLTGLATAVGPASCRSSRVGAMLTLLRLPPSPACASLRHHLADHPLEERKQRSS